MLGQKKNTEPTWFMTTSSIRDGSQGVAAGTPALVWIVGVTKGSFIMNPSQNHEKKLPEAVKWQGR